MEFSINTSDHQEFISITDQVAQAVQRSGVENGIAHIFVKHTTCGVTVNENADPDVAHDLMNRLDRLAPWNLPEDRHLEGNSAAHLKSSLVGPSVTIPFRERELVLGTWQGVYFCEFDGPRTRTFVLTILPG